MKNRAVIISGSPVFWHDEILKSDYVIACDSGYKHALGAGIEPDLIVGDFDSYTDGITEDIPVLYTSAEKDDTDTSLAVKYALALDLNDIVIYGATGGRIDHMLANFNTAAFITETGGKCTIADSENIITTLKDGIVTLERREGWSISIFSYSDTSIGITLKGFKYPLNNYNMTNKFAIGISNEFVEDFATVEVKKGLIFIIRSKL